MRGESVLVSSGHLASYSLLHRGATSTAQALRHWRGTPDMVSEPRGARRCTQRRAAARVGQNGAEGAQCRTPAPLVCASTIAPTRTVNNLTLKYIRNGKASRGLSDSCFRCVASAVTYRQLPIGACAVVVAPSFPHTARSRPPVRCEEEPSQHQKRAKKMPRKKTLVTEKQKRTHKPLAAERVSAVGHQSTPQCRRSPAAPRPAPGALTAAAAACSARPIAAQTQRRPNTPQHNDSLRAEKAFSDHHQATAGSTPCTARRPVS